MKFLFDENTPPVIPNILKMAFAGEDDVEFYWIGDEPFKRSMPDEEIFEIITEKKKNWCIIGFDLFRRHPIKEYSRDCLVLRLTQSDWGKMPIPERCWRFLKIFHLKTPNIIQQPLGAVYKLSKDGSVKPVKAKKKKK